MATEEETQGLVPRHAYAVLRAKECLGKRFVIVRNPWGDTEWTGAWSDGSKMWRGEWINVLGELNHTLGDDGQFVMECKILVFYFVTKLRDSRLRLSRHIHSCRADVDFRLFLVHVVPLGSFAATPPFPSLDIRRHQLSVTRSACPKPK